MEKEVFTFNEQSSKGMKYAHKAIGVTAELIWFVKVILLNFVLLGLKNGAKNLGNCFPCCSEIKTDPSCSF